MSSGSLLTPATWIRNFVRSHPAYKFDSVVSQEINYDLMKAVDEMCVPLLTGSFFVLFILGSHISDYHVWVCLVNVEFVMSRNFFHQHTPRARSPN